MCGLIKKLLRGDHNEELKIRMPGYRNGLLSWRKTGVLRKFKYRQGRKAE
jgi:hypothetical protein